MTLTAQQWIAIAGAAALLVWQFWPAMSSAGRRLWSASRHSGPATTAYDGDQDVADLKALKQVQDRFTRRGCPHAMEHIARLYACFFDERAP